MPYTRKPFTGGIRSAFLRLRQTRNAQQVRKSNMAKAIAFARTKALQRGVTTLFRKSPGARAMRGKPKIQRRTIGAKFRQARKTRRATKSYRMLGKRMRF